MANSFRQMRDGDIIKRTDSGMFIRIDGLHVKPDFNRREDDERTRQADDELFHYLMNGGTVPPLEVVVRDEGGVWIVEGHRRHRAYPFVLTISMSSLCATPIIVQVVTA